MKRIAIFVTVLSILMGMMAGCAKAPEQKQDVLSNYLEMLNNIPDDVCLTIYYMDPSVLTRMALSADDLIKLADKIVVESDVLKENADLLKKLDSTVMQPATIKSYINARMYYVLETEETGKILEVIISQVNGNVFVNGTEVVWNPVFLKVIKPFLPEGARILWEKTS